ncbi:hypothetical protein TRFO_08468 [Tritrichomonas foetus]|uniref:Tubby C-terminal domain-containing protein n=1 Tax=Tritrichomonas foetus TaxID=1144522 RepID=A0A1J4JJ93_9EUKA|nr:hypothetical protein TRFO_08468 [Tritrichomonas foetus]|eukprot:OHS99224.1 hypothetical protein TRFO_08468 [Tritrichomonas foetus]
MSQDNNNTQEVTENDDEPSLACYRSMRIKTNKGRGMRIHFQFTLDEEDLYHSKLLSKTQTKPIPIARGDKAHYSNTNPYYLIANEDLDEFRLMHNDTGILTCLFKKKKKGPKKVEVTWTEDRTIHLVNKTAEKTDAGKWCLDFDGRYAEPSIKNCILIHPETGETMAMFRRIDEWEMHVDAKPDLPDVMLFAVLLCLNMCPF